MSGEPEELESAITPELLSDSNAEFAPEPEEPALDPEVEREARKYGWRPKGMFTKNPDNWMDPARFLEHPSTQLKMQRDSNRALEERLARIDRTTTEAINRAVAQERAQWEQQLARVRQEKKEAVKEADVERHDALQEREDRLLRAAPPPPQPPADLPDWAKDKEMLAFAARAIDETPGILALSRERQIAWAEKMARAEFPDRFPDARKEERKEEKPRAARVDGGGFASSQGKGFDALPAEAQAVGRRFVKEGYFKDTAAYAKSYWEQDQ